MMEREDETLLIFFCVCIFSSSVIGGSEGKVVHVTLRHNCSQNEIRNRLKLHPEHESVIIIKDPVCREDDKEYSWLFSDDDEDENRCEVILYCNRLRGAFKGRGRRYSLSARGEQIRKAKYLNSWEIEPGETVKVTLIVKKFGSADGFQCGVYSKCGNKTELKRFNNIAINLQRNLDDEEQEVYETTTALTDDATTTTAPTSTTTPASTITTTPSAVTIQSSTVITTEVATIQTTVLINTPSPTTTTTPSTAVITATSSMAATAAHYGPYPRQEWDYDTVQNAVCAAIDGYHCTEGPWHWKSDNGLDAWFINCAPMKDNLTMAESADDPQVRYMCPTRVSYRHDGVLRWEHFVDCRSDLSKECYVDRTLSQLTSKTVDCATVKSGSDCVSEVWRDKRGHWFRGCHRIRRGHKKKWICPTKTTPLGVGTHFEDCKMGKEQQRKCYWVKKPLRPKQKEGFKYVFNGDRA